jgi:hypothetical protein
MTEKLLDSHVAVRQEIRLITPASGIVFHPVASGEFTENKK